MEQRLLRLNLNSTQVNVSSLVPVDNVESIELVGYSIFNTAYNINQYNATFGLGSSTITLPYGNYTASQAASILEYYLPASSVVVYDDVSGKFKIQTPTLQDWKLANYPSFCKLFGLNPVDVTATQIDSVKHAVMTNPYYYLIIKELPNDDVSERPCFVVIYNNVEPGGLLTKPPGEYIIPRPIRTTTSMGLIGRLNIELRDSDYNIVDLNGSEWMLEFRLTSGHRTKNTYIV